MVNKGKHPQMALIWVSEILYFTHIYIYIVNKGKHPQMALIWVSEIL